MRTPMNLNNRLKPVGSNRIDPHSRGNLELKIGLNNKEFIDSKFTRLISSPTIKGTYFQLSKEDSSFTEHLRLKGDSKKSRFFNKIDGFVAYNISPTEEIDPKDQEERAHIINLSSKTLCIPSGAIRPVEGDLFIPDSHQRIRKPFQVTKVEEKMLIDREVYEITLEESEIYSYEELMKQVTKEFTYLESNVGSGNKVIIESTEVKLIEEMYNKLDELNKEYIEAFYDELYDIIRIYPDNNSDRFITIRSLSKFQLETEIIKFGFNNSTLIMNNDYKYDMDDTNYNRSFYKQILKRRYRESRLERLGDKCEDNFINTRDPLFEDEMKRLIHISKVNVDLRAQNETFDYMDGVEDIKEFKLKFYTRRFKDHIVMTKMYNSGIELIELLEVSENLYNLNNNNVNELEETIVIKIENPLYRDIINIFLDSDKNLDLGISKVFDRITKTDFYEEFMQYSIISNDIEDMILFPLFKYIIEYVINIKTKDQMITSY